MSRTKTIRIALTLFLAVSLASLSAQELPPEAPAAQTIHETGKQYKEGNPLTAASDNQAIGSEAMFQANLKAKKNIVDMKPNTFLAMWNNPAFAVQFEKYLSAPAETSEDYKIYSERLQKIMDLLSPGRVTKQTQDEAFNLLTEASQFKSDANICTTIHDAVYAAANVRLTVQNLVEANRTTEQQLKIAQYNTIASAKSLALPSVAPSKNDVTVYNNMQKELQSAVMDPAKSDVAALKQTIQKNKAQIAGTEIQAKFQMQALILQLFVQRRYQHVVILDRFYRAIFDDGDQSLEAFNQMADKMGYNKEAGQVKLNADANPTGAIATGVTPGASAGTGAGGGQGGAAAGANVGSGYQGGMDAMALSGSGINLGVENLSVESAQNALTTGIRTASRTFKSLSQIDSIANEIIRDVNEGVQTYKFLLDQNEMESAATQLAAIFTKGEYLPSVRTLSREDKRKTLAYAQLCNRLVNAANSGNIDVLTAVVDEMKKMNPGFDDAEIRAKLQEVKTASSLLVAQAKVAAAKGDLQEVKTEITRAASLWPNNPELQSFSMEMSRASEKASPQVQALADFDMLQGQGNYRRIFEEREKYIAAVAIDDSSKKSSRQAKLREVLDRMQEIEICIMRAQEIAKRGDSAGAWEGLEIAFEKYPDDTKLSQMRADMTTQTPDFVNKVRKAKEMESNGQYSSSLAWYLRAQAAYPMSDLAKQGVQRNVKNLFPQKN